MPPESARLADDEIQRDRNLLQRCVRLANAADEQFDQRVRLLFAVSRQRRQPQPIRIGWEENRDILSTFFAYLAEVRKIIYKTHIIE